VSCCVGGLGSSGQTGTPPIRLVWEAYVHALRHPVDDPQQIAQHRDRAYWWYRDDFYWTNSYDYTAQDIKALLFARGRQRQRELEHAHALLAAASSPAVRRRERIPQDVKRAVWERDKGQCVECGSDFDIQYDHIIPFSMGGANTMENLQLLCARCNQQKAVGSSGRRYRGPMRSVRESRFRSVPRIQSIWLLALKASYALKRALGR
jgi:HNH endonuclease